MGSLVVLLYFYAYRYYMISVGYTGEFLTSLEQTLPLKYINYYNFNILGFYG
jgi:hypothetical protein